MICVNCRKCVKRRKDFGVCEEIRDRRLGGMHVQLSHECRDPEELEPVLNSTPRGYKLNEEMKK